MMAGIGVRLLAVLTVAIGATASTAVAAEGDAPPPAASLSASAPSSDSVCETACGVPRCYETKVRARPGMTYRVWAQCLDLTGASLTTPPAHSRVTNVSHEWGGLYFDVRPDEDAPRFDQAVFTLQGYEGDLEVTVTIETVPVSQNSAPVCQGDTKTQRSDGSGPVSVFLNPYCYDPDGDPFVIRGGPPGVHTMSPKSIGAGQNDSNWDYQTATFSGTERSSIWATDALGARSADAQLEVTVGPAVNRPPECRTSSWSSSDDVYPVYSRPGMVRRFAVVCADEDADDVSPQLSTPPTLGLMPFFEISQPQTGFWGLERWIDATYVPFLPTLERDPFTVSATGPRGNSSSRFEIVPLPTSQNGGGGCAWSGNGTAPGVPGLIEVWCDDREGDPLSVEVVEAPQHGTAAPAVITVGRYGESEIAVPYVPDPEYEGYDCIKIAVVDGNGARMVLKLDIWIRPSYVPAPLPPLPTLPFPPLWDEDVAMKKVARAALGTTDVVQLETGRGAEVWARGELSRDDLVRFGRAPAIFAVCSRRCEVRSDTRFGEAGSARANERRAVTESRSGQPEVISFGADRKTRLALKRGKRLRGRFDLSIRAGGRAPTRLHRSIPVGR